MRSGDYRLLGTVVSPHTEMQLKFLNIANKKGQRVFA